MNTSKLFILLSLVYLSVGCGDKNSDKTKPVTKDKTNTCVVSSWSQETQQQTLKQLNEFNKYADTHNLDSFKESMLFGAFMSEALSEEAFVSLIEGANLDKILVFLRIKRLGSQAISEAEIKTCKWLE